MRARTEMIKILDEEVGGTVPLAVLQDLADRLLELDTSKCPVCGQAMPEELREEDEEETDQDRKS